MTLSTQGLPSLMGRTAFPMDHTRSFSPEDHSRSSGCTVHGYQRAESDWPIPEGPRSSARNFWLTEASMASTGPTPPSAHADATRPFRSVARSLQRPFDDLFDVPCVSGREANL